MNTFRPFDKDNEDKVAETARKILNPPKDKETPQGTKEDSSKEKK